MHWTIHQHDCKSPLGKRTWLPAWFIEGRKPVHYVGGGKNVVFNRKYLFGNMPAFDVVRLEHNEGLDYRKDLELLFAGEYENKICVGTIV